MNEFKYSSFKILVPFFLQNSMAIGVHFADSSRFENGFFFDHLRVWSAHKL